LKTAEITRIPLKLMKKHIFSLNEMEMRNQKQIDKNKRFPDKIRISANIPERIYSKKRKGILRMKSIVLTGDHIKATDKQHFTFFKEEFEKQYPGQLITAGRNCFNHTDFFDGTEEKEKILISESSAVDVITSHKSIIVFKESFSEKNYVGDLKNCTAVVNAENSFSIKTLAGKELQTITCGLSGKDTITISSFTGDCVMISLQREIVSCSGKIIQPKEFPIKIGSTKNLYIIMSYAAAGLLIQ